MPPVHVPVLLPEIIELLAPSLRVPSTGDGDVDRPRVYVDGTLGLAGHARAMLEAVPGTVLVGVDRDPQALDEARRRLAGSADPERLHLVRARFDEVGTALDDLGIERIDATLLDLGLSSLQIDTPERGFAYSYDAPLDMRMATDLGRTAADIVNTAAVPDLARIFRVYGEERFAVPIARAIERRRSREPFERTGDLAALIKSVVPAAAQRSGHPAKRCFQALRIEVNGELDSLAAVLPVVLDRTAVGGRCAVISYHSLEDRAVKRAFAERCQDRTPPGLPVALAAAAPRFRLVTKGAVVPAAAELEANPRSASARLRVVERVAEDA